MFPIHLIDYFQPLSLLLIIQISSIWLMWDISGSFYAKRLALPDWTRVSWWFIGLGQSAFVFFLINLFLPLNKEVALASILIPTLPFIPIYLKNKSYIPITLELRKLLLPILIFLPLLPFVLAKASLPPYQFDEMAYHYLSPYSLASALPWSFSGGLYQVIPQNINIIFHILFAIFKTYSVARLTHFIIFFSTLLVAYRWISKHFGTLSGAIFFLLVFYTPGQNWVYPSTSGYIDIGTAGFTIVAILITIESLIWRLESPLNSFIFFSLALGSKYTSLLSAASYGIPLLLVNFRSIFKKNFIYLVLLSVSVGGFWYLKNIYFVHNPIYPFIFGCRPADCVGGASLFNGWTTPVRPEYFLSILKDLLGSNTKVIAIFGLSILLAIVSRPKDLQLVSFLIFLLTCVEFVMMHYFSGFYLRYFIHLRYLALVFISVQTSLRIKGNIITRYCRVAFILFVIFFLVRNVPRQITYYYYHDLTQVEKSYALGQTDIFGWAKYLHPKTFQVIQWCDNQKDTTILQTSDPDIIWFDFEGMSRVFMTNCQIKVFSTNSLSAKDIPNGTLFLSINPCKANNGIKTLGYENENQLYMRKLNNSIVCSLNTVDGLDTIYINNK